MSRQTQWLFEVPVALEGNLSTNLHAHPEYYQHPELEEEYEVLFVPPMQGEAWREVPERETGGLPEYPKSSRFVPAKFYSKSTKTRTIRRIVIHITDGGSKIQGTVSWFQHMLGKDGKPAVHPKTGKLRKASAHYIVGQDGEVVQMVRENDVAYHTVGANSDSIGIEHVANTRGLKPTSALYCSSAALVRWLCQKYGIPVDRVHILGHTEADPKTTHRGCPNAVWDWSYFMKLVAGVIPCGFTPSIPSTPATPAIRSLDINHAVQRNQYHAKALGWQNHVDQIILLLGFTTFTPNDQVFAKAVAHWQQRQGLSVDGILGPNTWSRMRRALASQTPPPPRVTPKTPPDTSSGKLVFEDAVTGNRAAFVAKVREISANLSIDPNWLMALMNHESRLDHRIQNKSSKATGLIQFMPSTAKRLGTTVDELRSMSNVEQLDYVYKYFAPFRGRIRSYADLYLLTFYPYALGKPDDYTFGSERSPEWARKIAEQNKGIDLNQDGVITMAEFKQWIYRGVPSFIRN